MADPRKMRRRDMSDRPLREWIRWRYCWWIPMRAEIRYAYYDARAPLAGWCNHNPKEGDGGPNSGYGHWRCQLRRRHTGMHRGNNYVWSDAGFVDYLPTNPRHTDQVTRSPWPRKHLGDPYWYRVQRMRGRLD